MPFLPRPNCSACFAPLQHPPQPAGKKPCWMPRRTNITAIAANNKLAIFDTVRTPARPSRTAIASPNRKTKPAIPIFTSTANPVNHRPCACPSRMHVVNTAGPVIKGTPIGTAPTLPGSTCRCLTCPLNKSLNDMASNRMPPAIMKSGTVTPRNDNSAGPNHRNPNATNAAVTTDCPTTARIRSRSTPSVKPRNKGKTPTASTATNNGTKQIQNSRISPPICKNSRATRRAVITVNRAQNTCLICSTEQGPCLPSTILLQFVKKTPLFSPSYVQTDRNVRRRALFTYSDRRRRATRGACKSLSFQFCVSSFALLFHRHHPKLTLH